MLDVEVHGQGVLRVGAHGTIDEVLVFQLHGLGSCVNQPWVASAQRDQCLMQPVGWLAQCGELGRGVGELRANIIVAAEPLLLDAHIALFVAVIDARHAADRHQHCQCQRRFGRAYLRGDARHIMIADERLWHEGI